MLTNKIEPIVSIWVETIGISDIIEEEIGTVIWSWTDYEGYLNRKNSE